MLLLLLLLLLQVWWRRRRCAWLGDVRGSGGQSPLALRKDGRRLCLRLRVQLRRLQVLLRRRRRHAVEWRVAAPRWLVRRCGADRVLPPQLLRLRARCLLRWLLQRWRSVGIQ